LVVGFSMLILFGLYEWKGRDDGIASHVFFSRGRNFPLSVFAFGVEGYIFYSAVAQFTPQIVLNLGFQTDSWKISIRQLSYGLVSLFASIPIVWYSTRFRDVRSPLILTFIIFLVVCCCYAQIKPSQNHAQIAFNVLSGLGQAGPLTLLVVVTQFTAPHEYLSTATGLAFSARAIGGALGSSIMGSIVNGKLDSYPAKVGGAAVAAGLPQSSVTALLAAFASGNVDAMNAVPGITPAIIATATNASQWAYAHAYRWAWISIIPFVVIAIGCVCALTDIKHLMTEHVEKSIEKNVHQKHHHHERPDLEHGHKHDNKTTV